MKLRGQGNAIPIALGVLAIVIAGSGTAVAVSSTTTISDPTVPSRIAHVDAAGRLLTTSVPSTSSLAYTSQFLNNGFTSVTSPTTASLAIASLQLSETRLNGTINGSDLTVYVVQTATANNACTSSVTRYLAIASISSGDNIEIASSAIPFVTKPIGTAPYCIGLYSTITNGGSDSTTYYPSFTFNGYVVKGSYTGNGTSPTPAAALPAKRAH